MPVANASSADHNEANRQSRTRLERLASGLDERSLRLPLGEHWTLAAGLLHLAFWDRFVLERWTHAARTLRTTPQPLEDEAVDLINDALTPLLLVAPVEVAATQAIDAARALDGFIAQMPAETVEAIRGQGRPRLIDRSLHRREHLDEIEALLSGS